MKRWIAAWFGALCWGCAAGHPPPQLESAGFQARFDESALIAFRGQHVGIGLSRLGRDRLRDVGEAQLWRDARVELRREGITEWWTTDRRGLEHGVTIDDRPTGDGALVLELRVTGTRPRTIDDDTIALGESVRYAGLSVLDATGARVPARMRALGNTIRIEVDDESARYPIVVDPLVYTLEATLSDPSGAAGPVAINADGTRAIVGVQNATVGTMSNAGEALVFVRSGTSWTLEATLRAAMPRAADQFGSLLALSADGGTAFVASYAITNPLPTVFVRAGTSWGAAPALPLAATFNVYALALSGDGTAAFVSGHDMSGASNSTLAFTRSGATWRGVVVDSSSASLALAADTTGSRLAGVRASGGGVVYLDTTANGWQLEATAPPTSPATVYSVALAPDGSRAIFGFNGEADVWVRSGTMWTSEASISLGTANNYARWVALDANADLALIGSGNATAVAQVYQRDASDTWLQLGIISHSTTRGVGLTAAGDRAIVGDGSAGVVFALGVLSQGHTCDVDGVCATGFCIGGVCCNTACGRGTANVCQACTNAATGAPDGTCAMSIPSTLCRASSGPCDPGSRCTGTSNACPAVTFYDHTTTCRAATGVCDQAETCTGTSAACPPDTLVLAGTSCGPPPSDLCDLQSACDGTSPMCPSRFRAAGTACGPAPSGVCDLARTCSGTSAACAPNYASGVVCRASTGACDIAESCSGTSASCPPDGVLSAGVVCRMASDPTCDPVEHCDGTATSCPPDVTMCAPMPDAGGHDAGARDGSAADAMTSGVDSGSGPPGTTGSCGCRASRSHGGALAALALAAVLFGRRRRSP